MVSRNRVFVAGLFLMAVSIFGLKSVTSATTPIYSMNNVLDKIEPLPNNVDFKLIKFEETINKIKENITEMNERMKQMAADLEHPKTLQFMIIMLLRTSSVVYIKNYQGNNYLGASQPEENPPIVVIQMDGIDKANSKYSSFKWSFEHERDNIFRIKNVEYDKYLSSSLETPQNKCRKVGLFTQETSIGNSGKWEVTFDENKIKIKNYLLNEYLFNGYDSSNMGNDFYICTFADGTSNSDTLWEIEF